MDDIILLLKTGVIVTILITVMLGGVGVFATVIERGVCGELQTIDPVHEYKWGFWSGCLVKTPDGYWLNHSEYKYLEAGVDTTK